MNLPCTGVLFVPLGVTIDAPSTPDALALAPTHGGLARAREILDDEGRRIALRTLDAGVEVGIPSAVVLPGDIAAVGRFLGALDVVAQLVEAMATGDATAIAQCLAALDTALQPAPPGPPDA